MNQQTNSNPQAVHSAFTEHANNNGMDLQKMLSGFKQQDENQGIGDVLGKL